MKDGYLQLFNHGFLPGANESKEEFYTRVKETTAVIKQKNNLFPNSLRSQTLTTLNNSTILAKGKSLFFSASKASIYEVQKNIVITIIQEPSWISTLFVSKKQVIDHELIHAKRAFLPNSKYEEYIAFRSSKGLRRFLSPIVSSNYDFLLSFFAAFLTPFMPLYSLAILGYLFLKLTYRQWIIYNAIKTLKLYFKDPENVLIGLSDLEIEKFAKAKNTPLLDLVNTSTFKWEFLNHLFGKENNL